MKMKNERRDFILYLKRLHKEHIESNKDDIIVSRDIMKGASAEYKDALKEMTSLMDEMTEDEKNKFFADIKEIERQESIDDILKDD